MIQSGIWSEYLDPLVLKEGSKKCPCCERPLKAYGYELDGKIVEWAYIVLEWCANNGTTRFDPREVFKLWTGSDYKQAVSGTPSKVKDHGIVQKTRRTGVWELTKTGYAFLHDRRRLSAKVWVFANRVVLRDDALVSVDEVDPRWKFKRSHWTMDYILQPYQIVQPQPTLL